MFVIFYEPRQLYYDDNIKTYNKKLINKFKIVSFVLGLVMRRIKINCYIDVEEKGGIRVEFIHRKKKKFFLDQNIILKSGGREIMDVLSGIEDFSEDLKDEMLTEISEDNNILEIDFNKKDI
jgi:hypothetical protein